MNVNTLEHTTKCLSLRKKGMSFGFDGSVTSALVSSVGFIFDFPRVKNGLAVSPPDLLTEG